VTRTLPFFPPDLFEPDRATLIDLVRDIGTGADQKFILGTRTAAFEEALAATLGGTSVVTCGSGTTALSLILAALDIGPGDEVVVPAFGCAPIASTVVTAGATPIFADVHADTMTLDPELAEAAITPRTKAIMPAHQFSVMADMPAFETIAAHHGVRLIEDSAVAQGAVLRGRPAGTWGDAGVFSFVQVKSFGMPGEGGAIITRDADLATTVCMLRNHGQDGRQRFVHHRIGHNSRFDEVMAAFQLERLPGLAARLARRATIAQYYTERFTSLAEQGIRPPPIDQDGRCHYVYCLRAERRDKLVSHLAARGVGTHVYYPAPLPSQPAFARHARPGETWPNAAEASRTILALPVYPHLTDAEVEHVADAVCQFATERKESQP
jgi:dTDP-4-amino-4,6-dideoxygalactose transaminase